jgi:SLAP domain-containing protein
MQELVFEAAWDKTIAPVDRTQIKDIFEETKDMASENIIFIPFREARNHENALLVSVLIHNFTKETFHLQDLQIAYYEDDDVIAAHQFSFPELLLRGKRSMPWTFIFPLDSQVRTPALSNPNQIIQLEREIREIS